MRGRDLLSVAAAALSVLAVVVVVSVSTDGNRGGVDRASAAGIESYADVLTWVESRGFELPRERGVVAGLAEVVCRNVDGTWLTGAAVQEVRAWFVAHAVHDAGLGLSEPRAQRLFTLLVQGCVATGHATVTGMSVATGEPTTEDGDGDG